MEKIVQTAGRFLFVLPVEAIIRNGAKTLSR